MDLIAGTLRRAPLAGLPLLVVYSVPVSLGVGGVSWWVFGLTAGGFLTMLFLQESEAVARWGRPLGSDAASDPFGFGVRTGVVRTTAGTVGGVATALAIVVPFAIPTLDLDVLPGGTGDGGGDISIENPIVDMRRDLQRGDDIPLLRVRTDDPTPSYLRIAVLNRYSSDEWSSGDREVPADQQASGTLPDLIGVDGSVPRTEHTLRGVGHRRLPLHLAADAVPHHRDRRPRRLALRPRHHGLPPRRQGRDHRRHQLHA